MFVIGGPVMFLLLFVFVFGGTLGAGLPGVDPAGGRAAYVDYVMPGILAMTIAGTAGGTATTVAMDMTEGIIARFRTMAISRAAVLAGHVLGNTIQAIIARRGRAGRRPPGRVPPDRRADSSGSPLVGVIVLIAFAISWLAVAMGMHAKSVETASNLPMLLVLLPFLGSGFVPTESMPAWLHWFAQYQPFTPFVETIRGLLLGTPMGRNPMLAIGWCVVSPSPGSRGRWRSTSGSRCAEPTVHR